MARAPMLGPKVGRAERYRIRWRYETDSILLAFADGLLAAGERIREEAARRAPHDTGKLSESGHVLVWANGKRIDFDTTARRGPRGFKPAKETAVAIVAFSDPVAHLQERGTVNMHAHPFLGPAAMAVNGDLPGILSEHFPHGGPDA
jgi:hypothetical protein